MKVIISDEKFKVLTTIYDESVRIPVKGDYIQYNTTQQVASVYEKLPVNGGLVERVTIDYVQNAAVVTVKTDS